MDNTKDLKLKKSGDGVRFKNGKVFTIRQVVELGGIPAFLFHEISGTWTIQQIAAINHSII